MADWLGLYAGLRILDDPAPNLGPPTDADLDRFERDAGFRLPLDYRAYIKVFGPGQLAYDYTIRGPGYRVAHPDPAAAEFNERTELAAFNEVLRQVQADLSAMDGPYSPEARRLVYFADNTAGDAVGWDPTDVRDIGAAEYGIYMVRREEGSARPLATSFAEFIAGECLGFDAARPEYQTFRPAWRSYDSSG